MAVLGGGQTGLVTSWGSPNSQVLTGFGAMAYTLNPDMDSEDATLFVASLTTGKNLKGLRMWSVNMTGSRPTPILGSGGGLTISSGGYAINVTEWDLTLECRVLNATVMGSAATAANWKEFKGGLITASGSFTAYVDDTTDLAMPTTGADPTITLTLASGLSYAFAGHLTGGPIEVSPEREQTVQYSFRNSGNVTTTGATLPTAAGSNLVIPTPSSLVLQSHSGLTFTGDAFWRRLTFRCPVDRKIEQTVEAQGTGSLTVA